MKKEILVFIFDGYADWESAYICSELNKPETGYVVKTIGLDKDIKTSMGGFKVKPDYSIDDYPKEFSMLLLNGGNAWIQGKNNMINSLVKYALNNNILVASICAATVFMGDNGYLDKIKHTSNTIECLKEYAPKYKGENNYVEKQAVIDGNIITANGTATLEFAKEIMIRLKVNSTDEINRWYGFHKKGIYTE